MMNRKTLLISLLCIIAVLLSSCATRQEHDDPLPPQTSDQPPAGQSEPPPRPPQTQTGQSPHTQTGAGSHETGQAGDEPGQTGGGTGQTGTETEGTGRDLERDLGPADVDPDDTPDGAPPESPDQSPAPLAQPIQLLSDLTVHFLDVGQADCILIQLPNNQTMLIDGGSRSGAQTVLDYLSSENVETIDYLVVTHPHEDHIGGLPGVINTFVIGEIYMPHVSHNTQIFERLLTAIQDNDYQINRARAGTIILSVPDLHIEIVAPVSETYRDLNNYSTIVRLTYKNVSFLFTGDAEALSENEITGDIQSDVLKVAHHGSHTSTSEVFLERVNPTYAIIFVGSGNSYGHPSETILSRLSAAGAVVFRTDEHGTIIATTDGDTIDFTFRY